MCFNKQIESYWFAVSAWLFTKSGEICSEYPHNLGKTFARIREETSRKYKINEKNGSRFVSIVKDQAAIEAFSMISGLPSIDRKIFSKCLNNLAEMNKNANVLKAYLRTSSIPIFLKILTKYFIFSFINDIMLTWRPKYKVFRLYVMFIIYAIEWHTI